jgi:hypothetical protein
MTSPGGYFFVVDEWRREYGLQERIEIDGTFTEAVSAPDWQYKDAEIVFLSLDGNAIDYLCLGRRGYRVATLKHRIRFTRFYHFDPPILLNELAEEFSARLRPHLVRTSQGDGRRVPPATWRELIDLVMRLRPESADAFASLQRARGAVMKRFTKSRTVIEERDAVNVAMRIAGMDERELLAWEPGDDDDPPEPFLAALATAEGYEAPMIEHDATVFGDWHLVRKHLRGATFFRRGGRRLAVFNVNARSVEKTLGVDLIYYTARYNAYVLVQYKRMVREDGDTAGYRPTDAAYQKEIAAMEAFERDFCDTDAGALHAYRLHPGPFYFKLCDADSCAVDSTTMASGIYLPLDYWQRVVLDPRSKGTRGGVRVTRDAVMRSIANPVFVELVQDGWIGSRTCRSGVIESIVNAWLKDDHSLILASCFDEEQRPSDRSA